MKIDSINGWDIYFHPLFARDYLARREKVIKLKAKLTPDEFKSNQDVKTYTKLLEIILKIIPNDPFAYYFVLTDRLKSYSRVKHKGLPDRYRLFFKIFKEKSIIVILWLGYPRKEGAKNDCYNIFSKMIACGNFPNSFDDLQHFPLL